MENNYRTRMDLLVKEANKITRKKCLSLGFPRFNWVGDLYKIDEDNGTNYVGGFHEYVGEEIKRMIDEQDDDFKTINNEVKKINEDLKDKYEAYLNKYNELSLSSKNWEEREKIYAESDKMFQELLDEKNKRIDEFEKSYYLSKV